MLSVVTRRGRALLPTGITATGAGTAGIAVPTARAATRAAGAGDVPEEVFLYPVQPGEGVAPGFPLFHVSAGVRQPAQDRQLTSAVLRCPRDSRTAPYMAFDLGG